MPAESLSILPTEKEAQRALQSSRTLTRLLRAYPEVRLRVSEEAGVEEEEITLPPMVAQLIAQVLEQIGQGQAVVVLPAEIELHTNQTAALIGVSRPFLTRLLDQGRIPFRRVGKQRRIRAQDALDYKKEYERRVNVMKELTAETEALGLYP